MDTKVKVKARIWVKLKNNGDTCIHKGYIETVIRGKRMSRIKEWRTRRGWSLQQLAEAADTTKSQIDKLEKGDRRLTVDWMVRLARPLGCEPRDLLPLDPAGAALLDGGELATARQPERHDFQNLIPVRSAARGGADQEMFLEDGPVDQVPRPYYLAHVRDAYAVYVVGTSMVPMYRPRQLLFIHPHKLPAAGQGVVVYKTGGAVLIKEFVRMRANAAIVREYQPALRDFAIPEKDIREMHAVVGATEP